MNHRWDPSVEGEAWRRLYPTQAALDAEFTLDTIPDLDALRRRRDLAAARGREEFRSVGPLAYATDPDETLLIFPPLGGAPLAPAQVFFHGGFWSSMQASDFAFLARGFVPFGAALVLVDYPLIPRVKLADVVASCRKALLWLHRHGADHGIDPQRLFISGNSAGGHLVAELLDDPACGFVRGGDRHQRALRSRTRGSLLPQRAAGADARGRGHAQPAPPDIADLRTAHRHRRRARDRRIPAPVGRFRGACRRRRGGVEHIVVPDADHITIVLDILADPGSELNRLVRRQMDATGRINRRLI